MRERQCSLFWVWLIYTTYVCPSPYIFLQISWFNFPSQMNTVPLSMYSRFSISICGSHVGWFSALAPMKTVALDMMCEHFCVCVWVSFLIMISIAWTGKELQVNMFSNHSIKRSKLRSRQFPISTHGFYCNRDIEPSTLIPYQISSWLYH